MYMISSIDSDTSICIHTFLPIVTYCHWSQICTGKLNRSDSKNNNIIKMDQKVTLSKI